jgi:hypothetical protein
MTFSRLRAGKQVIDSLHHELDGRLGIHLGKTGFSRQIAGSVSASAGDLTAMFVKQRCAHSGSANIDSENNRWFSFNHQGDAFGFWFNPFKHFIQHAAHFVGPIFWRGCALGIELGSALLIRAKHRTSGAG